MIRLTTLVVALMVAVPAAASSRVSPMTAGQARTEARNVIRLHVRSELRVLDCKRRTRVSFSCHFDVGSDVGRAYDGRGIVKWVLEHGSTVAGYAYFTVTDVDAQTGRSTGREVWEFESAGA